MKKSEMAKSEIKVTDLSRGGAGVGRDEFGRVVFVPYSAPGDILRVEIKDENKRYAQGEILEILEPSPVRQKPRCPAFGICGGCEWQHLPYDLQWETKTRGILHALGRVQVPIPERFDKLKAERVWEYRNRVQLRGAGKQVGFFRSGSRELVPVERCDIARPEINESWEKIKDEASRFSKPYKVEVEVLPSGEVRKTWNAAHSASGFRQVHDEQNEKLRHWIYNSLSQCDVLYDLFGGSGNLSALLQNKVREIHCVDISAPKSRPDGFPNTYHFHRAATVNWIRTEASKNSASSIAGKGHKKAAILDPPREGLGENFKDIALALEILGVTEIIAVGCDPDAWARDLSRWIKRKWSLKTLMAVDLFPQTHHIEAVGLLVL